MTYLSPRLRDELIDAWRRTGLAQTGFPDTAEVAVTARATFLQELIYVLYAEAKFRGTDLNERESLGQVSDAIELHRERMTSRLLPDG